MGFLGLVPVDQVEAFYDPPKQTLTLSAKGTAPEYTYDFDFRRVPWMGGLKFELFAWTGPLSGRPQPYEHEQKFTIPNLRLVDPGNKVIVVALNHPSGLFEEIRWGGLAGLHPPHDDEKAAAAPHAQHDEGSHATQGHPIDGGEAPPIPLTVLFREPFDIKQSIPTAIGSSMSTAFSTNALMMVNARTAHGELSWTFNSLETGPTQIIIYRSEGTAQVIKQVVYNVNVVVLDNALVAAQARSAAGLAKPIGADADGLLGLLGRVFLAVRLLREHYALPRAALLRVKAKPSRLVYPITTPHLLSQLECTFNTGDGRHAVVRSSGWDHWGSPVFGPGELVGAGYIDVEHGGLVSITDAVVAMRQKAIQLAFWNCTLERPVIAPGQLRDEPYYVFHMVDGSYVWVGAKDKDIIVRRAVERIVPIEESAEKSG